MLNIGIIQPNYIPWRGFFDFVNEVDMFVFLDDVQYTTRDWRNRNMINTKAGNPIWLSVPTTGGRNHIIKDVTIDNTQPWIHKHLMTLRQNYGKTPHFSAYYGPLSETYNKRFDLLSDLDIALTKLISGWLGIDTEFVKSSDIPGDGTKDERLLQIVKHLKGDAYLSGPAAQAYMRPELWEKAGVEVTYKDYSGYPEYPQISESFGPSVSVLDLLFMTGPDAPDYIWGKHRLKS